MLLGPNKGDIQAYEACKVATPSIDMCHWRHGEFIAINGWYSSRLSLKQGQTQRIAIEQPGAENPHEFAPIEVALLLRTSGIGQTAVEGDYLVCPLPQQPDNLISKERGLTRGCLGGVKNTVARSLFDHPSRNEPTPLR